MHRLVPFALALAFALCPIGAHQAREDTATVLRVIDGDTFEASIEGAKDRVQFIGVNTPESVDPRKPVEFYGKEASTFTERLLAGKRVILRDDPVCQDRDRTDRLLRYVYLEDGTFVNAELIKQGFGHVFVKYAFSLMEDFKSYERQAREKGVGQWASRDVRNEYSSYYPLVDRQVQDAWEKPHPPSPQAGGAPLTTMVTLTLIRSGRVTSLELSRPSGNQALDESALGAVRRAEPFLPFPQHFTSDSLTIHLKFVLTDESE